MRIFYAINFNETTMDELKKLQDDLREHVRVGRWAPAENFHITLHFIGEIRESELPFFREVLDRAAGGIEPFSIRFTSFGSFRRGQQDLIYLKAKYSGDSMSLISDNLKKYSGRGDFKPIKPHITLVRRAEMNHSTLKVLKKRRFELPPVQIDSVELMESRKSGEGIHYYPLHSVKL